MTYTVHFASRKIGVLSVEADGADRDEALAEAKQTVAQMTFDYKGEQRPVDVERLTPLAVEPKVVA